MVYLIENADEICEKFKRTRISSEASCSASSFEGDPAQGRKRASHRERQSRLGRQPDVAISAPVLAYRFPRQRVSARREITGVKLTIRYRYR